MCVIQVAVRQTEETTWLRPEDKLTPQRAFMLNETNPGSAVAAETAAAMAAGSMIFRERGKRRLFVATPTGYIMECGCCAAQWRCNFGSIVITRKYLATHCSDHLPYALPFPIKKDK